MQQKDDPVIDQKVFYACSGGSGCGLVLQVIGQKSCEDCLISIQSSISTKYVVQLSGHLLGTLYNR